ncbi:hypothetical protein [Caminicella sporogenes]|uniref:hypothetical protein n=1 Tax=Caminicella sporogenes TaxID=166485 RepID=UPI002540796E|nr:hypothetical protein [Caminicella sporogenes]WIF95137.1 hypothetical protein QNI18_00415 [Caminicella sporogenes]
MDSIKSYYNLCIEIDNLEEYIQNLEREIYAIRKLMEPGRTYISLDKLVTRFNNVENALAVLYSVLEDKKETRKKIIKNIRKLKGIDYKVVYLRDIKNMPLKKIAEKLGYSEIYIKEISARNKRII